MRQHYTPRPVRRASAALDLLAALIIAALIAAVLFFGPLFYYVWRL